MHPFARILPIAALLLGPAGPLSAQTAADPAGHWEGTVHVPDRSLAIEIDLARNADGTLAGTFGQPAQGVKGLPLSAVTAEGSSVRFVVRGGKDPSTFQGTVSDDGQSMSGDVVLAGFTIPFSMTRAGDARIVRAPKSPRIGKELEGTWNGTLNTGERQMRLVVKMMNQPDGSATGTIVSEDGSGVEIPIAMTQKGSSVTIDVPSVGAAYAGALNAAGTEVTGTWTQQSSVLPLTLRRAAPSEGKK